MMRSRTVAILLILVSCVTPAFAERRYVVRTTGGLGLVQGVCKLLGCSVVRGLSDPANQLFLLSIPDLLNPLLFLLGLNGQKGILGIEIDLPISLIQPISAKGPLQPPSGLWDKRPANLDGTTVWNGYAHQPAADIVRVEDAQNRFRVEGSGIVAVIDTGVDGQHPALRNVVIPGYDFTRNQPGGTTESADVNQSTAAVVDGSPTAVNDSTVAVVNQSTAAVVDDPKNAAFGHGTMVAGIIHLVAPRALIMSFTAFRPDGTGYTSDIISAIYRAVQSNARVINMSFSMPGSSQELKNALDFAVSRQVTCVSSAGNGGRRTMVYPAGFANTIGVGSTDLNDKRSSFSNYGNGLVWVAAPGEGVITTYPFGSYAAGWGTSFSTPFVAGTVALLLDYKPGTGPSQASTAVAEADYVGSEMGYGRLDVYSALQHAGFIH